MPVAAESLSLSDINLITGREYKSRDEALRHVKELNSFVGDEKIANERKLASEYNAMVEAYAQAEGLSKEEARKELAAQVVKERPASEKKDTELERTKSKLSSIEARLERDDFLKANPEAENLIDVIANGAKGAGLSLSEYYKESKLSEIARATKDINKNPTVDSKPRVMKSSSRLNALAKNAKEKPTGENQKALVEEFLRN